MAPRATVLAILIARSPGIGLRGRRQLSTRRTRLGHLDQLGDRNTSGRLVTA